MLPDVVGQLIADGFGIPFGTRHNEERIITRKGTDNILPFERVKHLTGSICHRCCSYCLPSFSYVLLRLREDKGFNASAPDLAYIRTGETVSLGDFLSELKRSKLISSTHIEKKFGMGHNTFNRLCDKETSITADTKDKLGLYIAYYLNKFEENYEDNLEALEKDDEMDKTLKKKKIEDLKNKKVKCSESIENFKKVFGSKAEYCLKRVREDDKFKS